MSRLAATVATVRLHRAIGIARRPRARLPRPVPPTAIAREYASTLAALVARIRPAFAPLRAALPELLASAARARQDQLEGKRAQELIDLAAERLRDTLRPAEVEQLAERFAMRTAVHQRAQFDRVVRSALGVDLLIADRKLTTLVDGFAAENVALIKGIPAQVASDIEKATTRAIQNGTRHEALAVELEQRFALGERRAMLIGRDQVGKLYGQIATQRHRELGISRFIWRTVGDERVRDEHQERNGKTFAYADLPEEELPGRPVLCRCYEEPAVDDLLAELDAL